MRRGYVWILIVVIVILAGTLAPSGSRAKEVVRPEEIKSLREVGYDTETYKKLAGLWKDYYKEYPSEYAYANWMYAARYAKDKDYSDLLAKGVERYPANPTLLYLKGLEHHGAAENTEGRKYLERAIAIDPNYFDVWFALVIHYMSARDEERIDLGLSRLLESGIIHDDIMDYNYNMLAGLDGNAILITNGDNDTYPAWILTRVLGIRRDVTIVNRSLLNTEWYPLYLIEQGLPRFIDKTELNKLRESILEELKRKKAAVSPGGPFGNTLVLRIIESASRAGRPVYVSKTVFVTDMLEDAMSNGRELGLVTLVTPSNMPHAEQLRKVYRIWLEDFRTGGLDSWRLRNARETDAGRMMASNYGAGMVASLEALKNDAPELRLKLFRWYIEHVEAVLSEKLRHSFGQAWGCGASDVKEIDAWRKQQGLECKKQ